MTDAIKKLMASAKTEVAAKKDQSLEAVAASLLTAVKLAAKKVTPEQLAVLVAQLKKVQRIVLLHHISLMKPFIGTLEAPEEQGTVNKELLDELEAATANKTIDNKRVFLLHRATHDFEYQKFIDQTEYKTTEETVWGVSFVAADQQRIGDNPVVSAWIPESDIVRIAGLQANTGTWGDLGENPHADLAVITVKAGVFTIYSELKS